MRTVVRAIVAMAAGCCSAVLADAQVVLVPPAPAGPGSANTLEQRLRSSAEAWIVNYGSLGGVVLGYQHADDPPVIVAVGTDGGGRPLAADSPFRIASITKTFLAAAVLQLAAEGTVNLDQDAALYVPNIPPGITLRMLLSHTSGLFDPVVDDPQFIPRLASPEGDGWTWQRVLAAAVASPLLFPPGTAYDYSNTNYLALGLVLEAITGQPLGTVLEERLIRAFRLDGTVYDWPVDPTHFVPGFLRHPVTAEVIVTTAIPYERIGAVSVDNIVSTASDLLRWARMLYGPTGQVVGPLQGVMLTPVQGVDYGLGAFLFDTVVGRAFGHGGETAGALSLLLYFPEVEITLVALAASDLVGGLGALRDAVLLDLFPAAGVPVDTLIAQTETGPVEARRRAMRTLATHPRGGDSWESLVRLLSSDPDPIIRGEAALALGMIHGGSRTDIVAALQRAAVTDPDQGVQRAAALALSFAGGGPPRP